MLKSEEVADPESTWNKTADDEPVFIVCARDINAAYTVRFWASLALMNGASVNKVVAALGIIPKIESWQQVRGSKVPD